MAENTLPDGVRWIENLLALGRALGYRAEPEFDVTPDEPEEAPVDVAWLTSESDRFPLFIFEVESRPSGQMTYNAAKVFGQHGYRLTSMELVAQECGLTRQALYHHFESKEALFRAVVEAVLDGARRAEQSAALRQLPHLVGAY